MTSSSSAPPAAPPATLLDLPSGLQRHVLAELDPPARLALFRTSHALARAVLINTPSAKRLIKLDTTAWPPALASLLDDPLLQPLADLELRVESGVHSQPPPPPPSPIAHHVDRLHLSGPRFTPRALAAWRLHDIALWPHLQHLTLHKSLPALAPTPTPTPAPPLQPIPRLQSFTWHELREGVHDDTAPQTAVLPLACQARRLRVIMPAPGVIRSETVAAHALAHLPHLTHADLDAGGGAGVEALLRIPTLEHLTLFSVLGSLPDFSQRACRWRTLTTGWAELAGLARLPLAGLERLTISGQLSRARTRGEPSDQAGLAVVQRLHGEGKLELRASTGQEHARWLLSPADGVFGIGIRGLGDLAPAVLRLVLEAGQGINTVFVDAFFFAPDMLERRVAPLLRQHPGCIAAFCVLLMHEEGHDDEEWWGALLGRLPACIAHLKVDVMDGGLEGCLTALVQGGSEELRHPLTLTLLHRGLISPELEAELMASSLVGVPPGQGDVGVGAVGESGEGQGSPLLTLHVVRYNLSTMH